MTESSNSAMRTRSTSSSSTDPAPLLERIPGLDGRRRSDPSGAERRPIEIDSSNFE